jgi:hypothetical protein
MEKWRSKYSRVAFRTLWKEGGGANAQELALGLEGTHQGPPLRRLTMLPIPPASRTASRLALLPHTTFSSASAATSATCRYNATSATCPTPHSAAPRQPHQRHAGTVPGQRPAGTMPGQQKAGTQPREEGREKGGEPRKAHTWVSGPERRRSRRRGMPPASRTPSWHTLLLAAMFLMAPTAFIPDIWCGACSPGLPSLSNP